MKKFVFVIALATISVAMMVAGGLRADDDRDRDRDRDFRFYAGSLVVSRSVYDNKASNVPSGTVLPPMCNPTSGACNSTPAPYAETLYPYVFDNDVYDASFGITSKIYLDQFTPWGWWISTLEVPSDPKHDHLVTSFSSKSELALNLSTDRKYLTFMGYVSPIDALDVSNSNTPGTMAVPGADPTNPVGTSALRAIGEVDQDGHFEFTETNAYSGNNGRAAIYYHGHGGNLYFTVGNAGNGGTPQPNGILVGAGAQIMSPAEMPESKQNPGVPTPLGSFSVTELGDKADKLGKDDNFRGLTIYNNVVYFTKGSGSNGVNTVYFVDTVGTACPTGVGLPVPGAMLPTTPIPVDLMTLQMTGLTNNMCVLKGLPTVSNKTLAKGVNPAFPFGIWFANDTTLYVADEGDGTFANVTEPTAGLQKWVFSSGTWNLVYTLQTGLQLGVPYTVSGYPAGDNPVTMLPWSPETDGLRNITGRVNWDGTVTIWGITSTVSGNGDQGADPNRLVAIADVLGNTDPNVAKTEEFRTLRTASYGEVLRGVSLTPGTDSSGFFQVFDHDDHDGFDKDRDDHDGGRDRR